NQSPTQAPPDPETRRALEEEHRATVTRTRLALDVLRLGGLDGVEGLEKELAAAEQAADKPLVWPVLGGKLREALTDKLRKQLAKEALPGGPRLSSTAHPFDGWAWGAGAEDSRGARLLQRRAAEEWRWCWDRLDYERCEMAALGE